MFNLISSFLWPNVNSKFKCWWDFAHVQADLWLCKSLVNFVLLEYRLMKCHDSVFTYYFGVCTDWIDSECLPIILRLVNYSIFCNILDQIDFHIGPTCAVEESIIYHTCKNLLLHKSINSCPLWNGCCKYQETVLTWWIVQVEGFGITCLFSEPQNFS